MGRDACAGALTRGDLNCAAALEERTSDLIVLGAPIQVSCEGIGISLRFACGCLLSRPSPRVRGTDCIEVASVGSGERNGAASLFRESF
jgi:hypothetical protein